VVGSAWAGGGIAFLVVVYLVVIVGSLVMMIVSLVDIVRRPEWQWKLAGQEKVLWLLLVILVNILAVTSLIYWFSVRKKLMVVEAAAAAGRYGPGHMTYGGWEPGPPIMSPYSGFAAPGWQPDPSGQHQFRWWDGMQWTEHTWSEVHAGHP
jgi:hypothetical protein